MPAPLSRPASWAQLALVTLSYLAVFGFWTWPLATELATTFPAVADHDGYMQLWNVWQFRELVLSGHNPFFTDWLLYPRGASLVLHTYTPIVGMLNLVVGNEVLALNLALALSYGLSGTGAWLLARRWLQLPLLAWLAGFVFAFSPYKMLRLPEHYDLVLTATVPFYVLAFLRAFTFEEGRLWPHVRSWAAVGGCLVLGLTALFSDYYITFGLLYFSAAYALWFGARLGRVAWRRPRTWLVLAGGLVLFHIAIRLLRLVGLPDNGGFWWGGDAAGYLMPPPNSRWLDFAWARQLYHSPKVFTMPGSIENVMFLGYTLPLLALVVSLWPRQPSVRRLDPAGRPLGWVLLFFFLLTLPALRVWGKTWLNLPLGALHFVPFLNNIRCPTRWVLLVSLLLPIVAFGALEAIWQQRETAATLRHLAAGLLLGLIGWEFWPQRPPLAAVALPPVYQAVAQLPGRALFTIPVGLVDGRHQVGQVQLREFLYQMRHHKKLPSAYISRITPEGFADFERDPVLRTIITLQQAPADTVVTPPTAAQAQAFRQHYHPDLAVVSPKWRNGAAHRYLRRVLAGYQEQTFADGYVLLRPASAGR